MTPPTAPSTQDTATRAPKRPRAATLIDVSKNTGFSIATVSRVLNGRPNVSEDARRKVRAAAQTLGYRVNVSARALVRQKTDNIGVVFPNIDNDYYREVLVGINDEARAQGHHLMVAFAMNSEDEPALIQEYLSGGRVDALIALNLRKPKRDLHQSGHEPIPLVLLAGPVDRYGDAHMVRMNNEQGADDAVTHLLEHGYRRLGVLDGAPDNCDAKERSAGVRRALSRAGLARKDVTFWQGNFFEDTGYDALRRAIEADNVPEAIFAANDSMAIGAMRALKDAGLRVPEDVAVIGFDDLPTASHMELSTVRSPLREMGARAARLAMELIDDRDAAEADGFKDLVLPTSLSLRRSCGCAACAPAATPAPAS